MLPKVLPASTEGRGTEAAFFRLRCSAVREVMASFAQGGKKGGPVTGGGVADRRGGLGSGTIGGGRSGGGRDTVSGGRGEGDVGSGRGTNGGGRGTMTCRSLHKRLTVSL